MFLFPEETGLFPSGTVSPMWAVGMKGNSRHRPDTKIYQLNTMNCPYLANQNTCRIYPRRPWICRGHPLTIHFDPFTQKVIAASVDRRCNACDEVPAGGTSANLRKLFSKKILYANAVLTSQFSNSFKNFQQGIWLFDLKQKRWKTVTANNVSQLRIPIRNGGDKT